MRVRRPAEVARDSHAPGGIASAGPHLTPMVRVDLSAWAAALAGICAAALVRQGPGMDPAIGQRRPVRAGSNVSRMSEFASSAFNEPMSHYWPAGYGSDTRPCAHRASGEGTRLDNSTSRLALRARQRRGLRLVASLQRGQLEIPICRSPSMRRGIGQSCRPIQVGRFHSL